MLIAVPIFLLMICVILKICDFKDEAFYGAVNIL